MSDMRVSLIPLAEIDEDVANHRLTSDPESDRQLQASIHANGVQQPLKVVAKPGGRYTLVFGFRRKAAAEALGHTRVPAIIEHGLDEHNIRALQAIENLERRELHPLEEARFCNDLAETIGRKAGKEDSDEITEAVAQRIGRSRRWVEARLALARLSPRVKQAFSDGDIHLAHAQLIARLAGHEAQEEVLGAVSAGQPSWLKGREGREARTPPATIAETRRQVENRLRDLDSVPWKLDAKFAGCPACSSCPQNSANRRDLFDDDEPKKPQCLDAACYAIKTKAASRAVVKATNTALKEFGPKVTPATAKGAIVMREVDFVRFQAVVDSAKKRQQPTEVTRAEKRGADEWQQRNELRRIHGERLEAWSTDLQTKLAQWIDIDDPTTLAMSVLIRESGIVEAADNQDRGRWRDDDPRGKDPQVTLKACLDLFVDGYAVRGPMVMWELAKLLAPWLKPEESDDQRHLVAIEKEYYGDISDGIALQLLATAYGITVPPRPTEEELEEELRGKAA